MLHKDGWLQRNWRPISVKVYLFICLFDFVVMPAMYEYSKPDINQLIEMSLKFNKENRIEALQTLKNDSSWDPLTLKGSGLFHLAFGSIITGSAVTRGLEKVERTKRFPQTSPEES